ncbi:hypothetical protein CXY45_004668 [Escherichia coli]|uniref:Uncharacterized protein n=7 Tax=Enterobacterales TaxID=91347 RepID=A0A630CCN8_SALER|nr:MULTISPECIES: hypothetical protein [Gammaproteobacteria]EAQ3223278.1 hypothetical protein [Salmonella enterica]EBF3358074.1 hypothetical protein [Salmonella enterica subsp. enterica serovar Adelaide]EBF8817705.1 hypothetical protein [Salmonella enterica subsp. enterica]ECM9489741.1 hypothetical protein [Salmonella enterica subsp. enterica serovar Agona]EDD8576686.1 hypothetical protein [Salmonella enterica subsp. enterica serovar Enteritidis]EDI5986216.1 hypothetical protein [Salmonella en
MSDSLDGFTEGDTQKEKQKVKQPKPFFNDVEESADRRHLRWTKSGVTLAMTILVAVMNWMVISMLYHVLDEELSLIRSGFMRADERTVTTSVYLALIAGTVAEVSALFLIIVKSVFKNNNNDI